MVKLTIQDTFGDPMEREGEIGPARVHGYEKDGSWALYGGDGWMPCYQVAIRWKRKRKFMWVMRSNILKCAALGIHAVPVEQEGE